MLINYSSYVAPVSTTYVAVRKISSGIQQHHTKVLTNTKLAGNKHNKQQESGS